MQVHLVDGTFELFRAWFGAPPSTAPDGRQVGATRGIARSLLSLVRNEGATHVGVAFDHVVESFRNDLFDGYKSGEGIEPELLEQFPLAEQAARALGFVVWPMVEFEADDGLAAAAARFRDDPRVEQVRICSPDKDMAQCVRGDRVVTVDRIRRRVFDEAGVKEKFGVAPESIPDWLALVGDAADGIPGVPRWGARSSAAALAACVRVDRIPDDPGEWPFTVRGAAALAARLREHRSDVELYRVLATLREDVPIEENLDDLEWKGARKSDLSEFCGSIGDTGLIDRVPRWRD
ncbi:MAG: flap endonuclease [bacterium]|nr:flap endonuclease [bacterium]